MEEMSIGMYQPFRPTSMRMSERSNETTGGSIDVDRNINAGLGLIFVKDLGNLCYWLIVSLNMSSIEATRKRLRLTVYVLPKMTKTPIVFSSIFCFTSSGSSL